MGFGVMLLQNVLYPALAGLGIAVATQGVRWLNKKVEEAEWSKKTMIDDHILNMLQVAVNDLQPLAEEYRLLNEDGMLSESDKLQLRQKAKNTLVKLLDTDGRKALDNMTEEGLNALVRYAVDLNASTQSYEQQMIERERRERAELLAARAEAETKEIQTQ